MRIANNIPALAALRALTSIDAANQKSSLRLSSGNKINSAADDAAGLAISNKLRNQLNGIERANLNSSNGISIVQTADGSLNEIHAALQRIRELAVQASNDTNEENDKEKMQDEIDQLLDEVNSMAGKCEYNKMKLLRGGENDLVDSEGNPLVDANGNPVVGIDGSQIVDINGDLIVDNVNGNNPVHSTKIDQGAQNSDDLILKIQVGGNQDTNMAIILPKVDTERMGATHAGIYDTVDSEGNLIHSDTAINADYTFRLKDVDITQQQPFQEVDSNGDPVLDAEGNPIYKSGSQQAMNILDAAIADISAIRSRLGAYQNRLQYTVNNLANSSENTASALSRIADTDMAAESTEYAKTNVMLQAATSVLAQANQRPQMILQLIK